MNKKNSKVKKESDISVLMKLFAIFARNNRSTIIVCIILALLEGTRVYVPIFLTSILIDGLTNGTEFAVLMRYAVIGLAISFVLRAIASYLREYFNARVENCMERQNYDLNAQSMKIKYEYLENPRVQEKKQKQEQVVNMNGGIYWMIIWPLDRGLTGLITVITAVVVAVPLFIGEMGSGSGWMTVALLAVLIVAVTASYRVECYNNDKSKRIFDKYAELSKVGNYFRHHILFGSETAKDLRIFSQEKLIDDGIHKNLAEEKRALNAIRTLWMKQNCFERSVTVICCGCIYLYAAFKAYIGLITIGSVVRYASSILKCVDGMSEVLYAISSLKNAANYGREYLDYINFEEADKRDKRATKHIEADKLEVEFDNVSFKYPGSDKYVIKNLSLKMDVGERMAIVGKNGSGKTTFIKLLCRLYDVTEGTIRLNGTDIREYDYDEYLGLFSVVFQDYRMFSLKVGENIAASENVDEARAIDAINKAGLKERFGKMEAGLDTYVGKEFDEHGVNVSGGEKQKLAIARAIYKDAPFVIMDEPTAALDPVSECEVYSGFDKMVGDKTAIYISHRLASCRFCNDILVFDKGNVVQRGSHEELVCEDGLYKKLWDAQAQYYTMSAENQATA